MVSSRAKYVIEINAKKAFELGLKKGDKLKIKWLGS
jgi:uncharacterized membrane protein (UPF0127 family)